MAGTGPVGCGRERVSYHVSEEGTGSRGRKPDAPPDCHSERD